MPAPQSFPNIAVIGAGISGLTAAYRLDPENNITVFEANDYVGGHTNTVDIEFDGERHAIDVGFIVFNDWTYPEFISLLHELGGARTYVNAMTSGFRNRIRLRTPVHSVRRFHDRVMVQPLKGPAETFDHVIFACHSDQVLRILGDDATSSERRILSAFPYERNVAVLHTDISMLPQTRRA